MAWYQDLRHLQQPEKVFRNLNMTVKIAVLMDAVEHVKAYKDSSVAMLQGAQKKGWSCYYFRLADLSCENGQAFADVSQIKILDTTKPDWFQIKPEGVFNLNEFDIILMRKDPPFDMEYVYATYALDLAKKQGVLVVNDPQVLRDANEKFYTLNFPQCCPKTIVSRDISKLKTFWETHQNVIFKPLEGMGGKAVFHVPESGENLSVILEVLSSSGNVSVMGQVYIPEISITGDKRILMIDGKPIPYALARIPAKGELRGNLAAGATGKIVELTKRDYWICEQLEKDFKQKGIYFAGIDVIGDYLTEINITSPTCIKEIEKETGLDIAGELMNSLQQKMT